MAMNTQAPSTTEVMQDNMNFDASVLWWDRTFEMVTDQYGFLIGGYPPPDMHAYQ